MNKAESQHALQQAIKLLPEGKIHDAAALLGQVVKAFPDNVDAIHLLGAAATLLGRYEAAEQLITKAIRMRPEAGMYQNLARNTQVSGDLNRARLLYLKALELDPRLCMVYYNLSQITKYKNADPAFIGAVLSQLKNSELSSMDRSFLNFAAGKYFDDQKQFDKAFIHYTRGNMGRGAKFDKTAYVDTLNLQLSDQFSRFYATPIPEAAISEQAVFIVGMPRSGTTLLEQALSGHSQIFGAGEVADIPAISQKIGRNDRGQNLYPQGLLETPAATLARYGESYLKTLQNLGGDKARIIDKNPVNHQHIGLIAKMLPNAKFIHCRRDAMDICISCYFQNFRVGQDFSFTFEGLATYYQGYSKYMEHWKKLFPDQIIDISYEETVGDLEQVLKKVLDFLDLTWEQQCLDFHTLDRPVSTASLIQVREPLYKDSLSKYQRYGDCFKVLRSMLATEQFA